MVYKCPLCGQEMDNDFDAYLEHMEGEIVEAIKGDHPEWAERDGSCLKCRDFYQKQIKG